MFSWLMHLYTKFECTFATIESSTPLLPPIPFNQPQITPSKIFNCTPFSKMNKITRSSRLERWCQATIACDKRTPPYDQKHKKIKRRKTMIYISMTGYNHEKKHNNHQPLAWVTTNEKNTTRSTRMTRKSQRQWQWCSK
jgi:hypothetical protein